MLSDDERRAFDEIVRGLGPIGGEGLRTYLMPWWLPPALLALYAPMLLAASLLGGGPAAVAGAIVVAALAWRWGAVRRARCAGSPPLDLARTPPFIA